MTPELLSEMRINYYNCCDIIRFFFLISKNRRFFITRNFIETHPTRNENRKEGCKGGDRNRDVPRLVTIPGGLRFPSPNTSYKSRSPLLYFQEDQRYHTHWQNQATQTSKSIYISFAIFPDNDYNWGLLHSKDNLTWITSYSSLTHSSTYIALGLEIQGGGGQGYPGADQGLGGEGWEEGQGEQTVWFFNTRFRQAPVGDVSW